VDKTVEEIVKEWLVNHGYDGLCSPDESCGCGVDDLMPCGADCRNCMPAHKIISNGEVMYVPKIKKEGL